MLGPWWFARCAAAASVSCEFKPKEGESLSRSQEYDHLQPPPASDVIVVGGGPAGCAAATFLAQRGWSVTLLEKDHHPRFHIGESLLPMNLPILQRLGVLDAIKAIGTYKSGADFSAIGASRYTVFRFDRALDPTWPHAYQVRRDEFDAILFDNASKSGVAAFQGCKVDQLDLGPDQVVVEGSTDAGKPFRCEARYLVDATGRDTLIGNKLGLKARSRRHQSAALFAHFSGVTRRQGEEAGNISIYNFEHGWVWVIPLRDGITSIGAVCWPDYLKRRRTDNREFLLETLRSITPLRERLADAQIVGNLHATGNYSYSSRKMTGRRWIMVGDAYAFVDPIFSSGVYLAMHGAEIAAKAVDGALREPSKERSLQRDYARQVKGGLRTLSWFIYRFTSPAMRKLFAHPRNDWQLEQAMISMLAGDVFRDQGVMWRLRVFKLIYFGTAFKDLGRQLRSYLDRRRQVASRFEGGTTRQDSL
jgi:flavin-dependent dehydrogenase